MKWFVFYFILFITSSSCASSTINSTDNVKSWNTVDPTALNEKIKQAYATGKAWARKPQLYVFNIFYFDEIKNISYEYSVDNTESPQNVNIKITRDGFLDDSVRGDIHQMRLNKNKTGQWQILSIKKAHSCWRLEPFYYSIDACP